MYWLYRKTFLFGYQYRITFFFGIQYRKSFSVIYADTANRKTFSVIYADTVNRKTFSVNVYCVHCMIGFLKYKNIHIKYFSIVAFNCTYYNKKIFKKNFVHINVLFISQHVLHMYLVRDL